MTTINKNSRLEPARLTALSVRSADVTSGVSATGRQQHLNYLDSLRGLAALYVVWHHAAYTVWTNLQGGSTSENLLCLLFAYGRWAVIFFLVLSGYCLMLPVIRNQGELKGGAARFFKRRAWRILPPYYAAIVVSLILIRTLIGTPTGTHWDNSIHVTTRTLLAHLLLIQNFKGAGSINNVFWSIAVEWQIYFLFPALLWLWRRVSPLTTTGLALLLGFSLAMLLLRTSLFAAPSPQFLGFFALGMLAADIATGENEKWQRWSRIAGLLLAISGAFLFLMTYIDRHRPTPSGGLIVEGIVAIAAILFLILISRWDQSRLRRLVEITPLPTIGRFSYSLYLLHAPMLQIVWQYVLAPMHLGHTVSFLLLCALATPLSLAVSYLFFLAFERPFLRSVPSPVRV